MTGARATVGALPASVLEPSGKGLHIGGKERREGWLVLDALPGEAVDVVGDVRDLSQFAAASFDMVYASHVLEHVGYQKELPATLRGIARILRPGGRLFVAVPDLTVLCKLFVHPKLDLLGRFGIMRMMFGGQGDAYDFHHVGFSDEILATYLGEAGFSQIFRVPSFGLFQDTSEMRVGDAAVSLNMVAIR